MSTGNEPKKGGFWSFFGGSSGSDVDRYGQYFGFTPEQAEKIKKVLTDGPGAEQERHGQYFGLSEAQAGRIREILTSGPGAEQDRYSSHFSLPQDVVDRVGAMKASLKLGSDQDIYGRSFGVDPARAEKFKERMKGAPKADQDIYGRSFGIDEGRAEKFKEQMKGAPRADQDIYGNRFGLPQEARDKIDQLKTSIKGESTSHMEEPFRTSDSLGIIKTTILPSFSVHSGLSLVTYAVARYTNKVEYKDYLWPAGITANAWWSAIGLRMYERDMSLPTAWSTLSYPEKLLLGGVTAWGGRLFYRVVSRSIERNGDDPRYEGKKNTEDFWNQALYKIFLPEAAFQTLISLPFALPFRDTSLAASGALIVPAPAYAEVAHMAAVFLFGSGFALEVLADTQLAAHRRKNWSDINQSGVWSIVRHPNYLGDAIIHSSFPLLLYSCGLLHPVALLAPVANYVFLRYFGGDQENEASQVERYSSDAVKSRQFDEYRRKKNSFWPNVEELVNPWFLTVAGVGVAGVVIERGVREYLLR